MSNFNKAFEFVLGNEGGFTDHPADRGGATNWGITISEYARYKGKEVSTQDVKNMTKEEAKEIYYLGYWKPLSLDQVIHHRLAVLLFDQGVNRGISAAAKDIQKIVGVVADGKVGPKTIEAINKAGEITACFSLIKASQLAYAGIVLKNQTQLVFLKGWLNRTHRLIDFVLGFS